MIWGISKFDWVLDFVFFHWFFNMRYCFSPLWILNLRRSLKNCCSNIHTHSSFMSALHIFTFWKCSCEQIFAHPTALKRWIKELRNIIKANTCGAWYMNIYGHILAGLGQCQQGFSTTYRSALLQIQRYALLQQELEDHCS